MPSHDLNTFSRFGWLFLGEERFLFLLKAWYFLFLLSQRWQRRFPLLFRPADPFFVTFGKRFEIFNDLFLGWTGRRNKEDVFASRAANLCSTGWNLRVLQIELRQTGSAGYDHRQALSLKVNDIMMKGVGKIKAKVNFCVLM
jgi:hypothetical protein